jgi:hypothetical protein
MATATAAAFTLFAYFGLGADERVEEHSCDTLADVLALSSRLWADHEANGLVQMCFGGQHEDLHFDGDELYGDEGSVATFVATTRRERAEDDAEYAALCRSEGRWMAGSAFGNQGLADYDGLDLDYAGSCEGHQGCRCDDCY